MNQISYMPNRFRKIIQSYLDAKMHVINKGYEEEIEWQDRINIEQINESYFLREAAWVVLSSGMREQIIRSKFPHFSKAFYMWENAEIIVKNSEKCRDRACKIFCHLKKIDAIITISKRIEMQGFKKFKTKIQSGGIEFIQELPFMGPATAYHLAKNIGLDVVKPDRHLIRVATATGYNNPEHLCEDISKCVGDPVSVVDIVIWRFATLNSNYLTYFS